jgi:oligopeptidase A
MANTVETFLESEIPCYGLLKPEDVQQPLDALLAHAEGRLLQITQSNEPARWESVIEPLTDATERLGRLWSAIHHMGAVMDSPEWRELTNNNLERISRFWSGLSQNKVLFEKTRVIHDQTASPLLSESKLRALKNSLRDFRLGGVDLAPEAQSVFAERSARLATLSQQFSENLLDSTNATKVLVSEEQQLAGLPQAISQAAIEKAKTEKIEAFAVFGLQQPSLIPVLQFADDRKLREEIYSKNARRASELAEEGPDHDNSLLMAEILYLRQEQAKSLGFASAAELSLASKMADSPQQVMDFLLDLAQKARPFALQDVAELRAFAKTNLGLESMESWDVSYVSEKLRQNKFSFSEDEVRQYFQVQNVLAGLFQLVEELFGVVLRKTSVTEPQYDLSQCLWHPDVQLYSVLRGGTTVGYLFLDPYSRATKRGGAWMDDSRGRRQRVSVLQKPVAMLTCNFMPPNGDQPSTISHDDVTTLFHEFGHGLHHLLTEVDELEVSGINGVEWDAVELPSQFMENFCWEWEKLQAMTSHVETGKPLPRDLYEKMIRAKNFQSGLFMLRQIEFALFDLRIHHDIFEQDLKKGAERIMDTLAHVRSQVAVLHPPSFQRFPQSFSHIFAGGYAAGYYSYKWAEVLSADAYAAFEEEPQNYGAVGQRFWKEILAKGGSRPAIESFRAFRGREPSPEALLRHSGLLEAA